jgi:hypothetical protein
MPLPGVRLNRQGPDVLEIPVDRGFRLDFRPDAGDKVIQLPIDFVDQPDNFFFSRHEKPLNASGAAACEGLSQFAEVLSVARPSLGLRRIGGCNCGQV